jgi:uncharacterized protein
VQCPKCSGTLQVVVQDSMEIDRCDQCGGLWFDMLELDRLRKSGRVAALDTGDAGVGKDLNRQAKVNCPRCNTLMIPMVDLRQSHIWYESCGVCFGKWFDAGEIKDLSQETIFDFFRGLMTGERK